MPHFASLNYNIKKYFCCMTRSRLILFLLILIAWWPLHFNAAAQNKNNKLPAALAKEKKWVDSIYNVLTPDERIGQLFMVAAYSGGKSFNEEAQDILHLLSKHSERIN